MTTRNTEEKLLAATTLLAQMKKELGRWEEYLKAPTEDEGEGERELRKDTIELATKARIWIKLVDEWVEIYEKEIEQ